jgi:hypothetical protein
MTERLAAAIRQQRHLRSRRALCKDDGTPLTRQGAWSRVRFAAKRAKVPTGVHILRHTFCSHLAMQGAPMRGVHFTPRPKNSPRGDAPAAEPWLDGLCHARPGIRRSHPPTDAPGRSLCSAHPSVGLVRLGDREGLKAAAVSHPYRLYRA